MSDQVQTDETLEVTPSSDAPLPSIRLSEDLALAQLKDPELSSDDVEQISRNDAVMKSRKVRRAVASHPHAPRRIALRIVRELYTFELMQLR